MNNVLRTKEERVVNKKIMREAGFKKEVDDFEKGICPFCKRDITENEFRSKKSLREYKISGLCQRCQDKMFSYPVDVKSVTKVKDS